MKYNYDDTGIVFNYFVLSVLVMILFPTTYSYISGGKKGGRHDSSCICEPCRSKRRLLENLAKRDKPFFSKKLMLLIFGWVLLGLSAYKAATTSLEETVWDPYAILELDFSSTKREIKRRFFDLSRQWHPDKVEESLKETAAEKYNEISKAYKTLTDEEAKKVWEETGHPDGKQSTTLGVALPGWLVDEKNQNLVLLVYGLIFGIGLPVWVAKWWNKSKNLTKDKIIHDTMGRFYRELKDNMTMKNVIDVLTIAEEFNTMVTFGDEETNQLVSKIKATMQDKLSSFEKYEKSKKYPDFPWSAKVNVLVYAHLLRVSIDNEKVAAVQLTAVPVMVHLLSGMLQIAISRNWLSLSSIIIELSQCLVQAVHFSQPPVVQLPLIENPEVLKHFKTKKKNISTIRDYVSLEEEDRRNLLRKFSDEEFKLVEHVASEYPSLKIVQAYYKVLGEPAIIPNSLVTLIVKLKLLNPSEARVDKSPVNTTAPETDEPEEEKKQWWKNSDFKGKSIHSPYFPGVKKPLWWIMMGDVKNGRLITLTKVEIENKEKTARIQFQAPPNPGQWIFQVIVKSDSILGCDITMDLKLNVQDYSAAPLVEVEDDISEPEEDSLAGQLQAAKSQRRQPKGEYEDSSDDDSDVGDAPVPEDDCCDHGPDEDFVE